MGKIDASSPAGLLFFGPSFGATHESKRAGVTPEAKRGDRLRAWRADPHALALRPTRIQKNDRGDGDQDGTNANSAPAAGRRRVLGGDRGRGVVAGLRASSKRDQQGDAGYQGHAAQSAGRR